MEEAVSTPVERQAEGQWFCPRSCPNCSLCSVRWMHSALCLLLAVWTELLFYKQLVDVHLEIRTVSRTVEKLEMHFISVLLIIRAFWRGRCCHNLSVQLFGKIRLDYCELGPDFY